MILQLLQTLDELLMLNLDVITHVITWFITLVADHQHVKRELCDEVSANKENMLEYLAKTDTHLHRSFVESMRIRPFASKLFQFALEAKCSRAYLPINEL